MNESSLSGVELPACSSSSRVNCEYCNQPLPEPNGRITQHNLNKRKFCNHKCRAMKWKLDHPETWGRYGMPAVAKANLGLPE